VDGPTALAELERAAHTQHGYALALLDMMMPGMDGLTLADQIRQRPLLAGLPLLLLSSAGRPNDESRWRTLGLARCLLKPVKQSVLLAAMADALGIATTEAVIPAHGVTPRPDNIPSRHILLVEDGLVNQQVAVDLLTQRGHTVVVANNGREALAALATEAFDLILMDLQMPEMDGLAATAAIRAREQTTGTHIPIVAMTAEAMAGDRERCLVAGMDGYIAKPVRSADLYHAVEEMAWHTPEVPAVSPAMEEGTSPPPEASNAVPAAPPCDWEKALAQLDGKHALLHTMVELFLEECPKLMTGIRDAITRGQTSDLRRTAHTLHGSANVLAAEPVAAAALRLETMARDGDLTNVEDAWLALQTAVGHLLPALRTGAQGMRPE